MPELKLYKSEVWLYKKYVKEKLSEEEIAKLAGTTQVTINRYLRKYGFKRSK